MTFPASTFRPGAPRTRFAAFLVVPLVVALSATACGNNPTEPEEPEIGTLRLTVGASTLSFAPGATLSVTIGEASTAVSAAFLAEDGSALTLSSDEFEIRLLPRTTGVVTFNRSTAFSGALVRTAAGSVIVDVQVFHKIEGHSDFDAVLNLTVQ